jgi:hypothetical protein
MRANHQNYENKTKGQERQVMLKDLGSDWGWRVTSGWPRGVGGREEGVEVCKQVTNYTWNHWRGLPRPDLDFYLIILYQTGDKIQGFVHARQVFYHWVTFLPSWLVVLFFLSFICVCVCVCVCVCTMPMSGACWSQKRVTSPRTTVTDSCEPLCEFWDHWVQVWVPLILEPSLQPHKL